MLHREVLDRYPREMLEDIPFTKFCIWRLVNSLVDKTKCDRKDITIRVAYDNDDSFMLDKVTLIAEVEIKD